MEDKTYEDGLGDGAYIALTLMLAFGDAADDFSNHLGSTVEKMQLLGEWAKIVTEFWEGYYQQDDGCALVDFDEYVEDLADWVAGSLWDDGDGAPDGVLPNIEEIENHCKVQWEGR